MRNNFLVAAFLFFCLSSFGQNDVISLTEQAFASSEHQWLSYELSKAQPQAFNNQLVSIEEQNKFLGELIARNEFQSPKGREMSKAFTRLYFPDGSSTRYQFLKAETDLYFPLFDKKLSERNLPTDYKYLAVMMSGLDPHYCSNTDRCGLWGMDFLVARKYQLRIDSLVDERRGGDFTAVAAAKYLADLHKQFGGDQHKVVAAYCRSVAYAESGAKISDDDYVLLYLYTKAVFEKFYLKSQLNNCFDILGQLKSFWFDQNTQVQALKEVVGVSDTLLHAINPVYTGKLIEAKYRKVPYVMPLTEAAKFALVADSVYNWQPHAPKPIYADEEEHGDVTYHKVKRGESLGTIAAKYHVSIKQLKKWNHLKRDMIREGQKLKIEK